MRTLVPVMRRVGIGAVVGAAALFLAAQAMRAMTGGCTLLCDPQISLPLGAIVGAVIFATQSADA